MSNKVYVVVEMNGSVEDVFTDRDAAAERVTMNPSKWWRIVEKEIL